MIVGRRIGNSRSSMVIRAWEANVDLEIETHESSPPLERPSFAAAKPRGGLAVSCDVLLAGYLHSFKEVNHSRVK
jgi:hypothetical protein